MECITCDGKAENGSPCPRIVQSAGRPVTGWGIIRMQQRVLPKMEKRNLKLHLCPECVARTFKTQANGEVVGQPDEDAE